MIFAFLFDCLLDCRVEKFILQDQIFLLVSLLLLLNFLADSVLQYHAYLLQVEKVWQHERHPEFKLLHRGLFVGICDVKCRMGLRLVTTSAPSRP